MKCFTSNFWIPSRQICLNYNLKIFPTKFFWRYLVFWKSRISFNASKYLKYGFCNKSHLTSWTLFWAYLSSIWVGPSGATATSPKSDEKYAQKSVQLVRGSSFLSDFLQNPYFKRVRAICHDDSLWKKINLYFKTIPAEFINYILIYGNCKYLSLWSADLIGNMNLNQKSPLKYLDLNFCKANDGVLNNLISACDSLEKLSLRNLTLNGKMIKAIGYVKRF